MADFSKLDPSNPYPRLSNTEQTGQLDIEANFVRFKTMITPRDVITFGLVGVPKTFPMTNEPITEEYVALHLQSSISELEMMGMYMSAINAFHVDDFHEGGLTTGRYMPTILKKYPVRSITSIELRYPNAMKDKPSLIYRIPDDWITFEQNKINVIATTGFLAPNLVSGSANMPLVNLFQTNYRPQGYRVEYKAGFDQDKLPVIVWQLLCDMTTFAILSEIAPLLFPSTSINVSIDSVGQSANLPGPKIFEGRLNALKLKIDRNRNLIASYYGMLAGVEFMGL
jgi:hypothetical protein